MTTFDRVNNDQVKQDEKIRTFGTGANRGSEEGKLDFEGFLSPLVLERYAEYLHGHRELPDGSVRASDNWQRGMPLGVYMKSAWRHLHAWWTTHRGWRPGTTRDKRLEDAVCAVIFNASGYLHEVLKAKLVRENTGGHPVVVPPMKRETIDTTLEEIPVVPSRDSNRHC